MELELKGIIKEFTPIESGTVQSTGKDWQKTNLIVTNNEGHEGREQLFCFEVFGTERVEKLTQYNSVGDEVLVKFNIRTNEWKGKYYTSLAAWRVEKKEASEPAKRTETGYDSRVEEAVVIDDQNDELPF